MLEAAELRGDESDAELDSDADSDDLELGSEIELDDAEVESDAAEAESEAESDADESDTAESDVEDVESDAEPDESGAPAGPQSDLADDPEEEERQIESDQLQLAGGNDVQADSVNSDSEPGSEDESASANGTAASASDRSDSDEGVSEAKDLDQVPPKQNKPKLQPSADSLQTLKKKLAAANQVQEGSQGAEEGTVPIEWGRVLTAEDFERIKELRHRSDLSPPVSRACEDTFSS